MSWVDLCWLQKEASKGLIQEGWCCHRRYCSRRCSQPAMSSPKCASLLSVLFCIHPPVQKSLMPWRVRKSILPLLKHMDCALCACQPDRHFCSCFQSARNTVSCLYSFSITTSYHLTSINYLISVLSNSRQFTEWWHVGCVPSMFLTPFSLAGCCCSIQWGAQGSLLLQPAPWPQQCPESHQRTALCWRQHKNGWVWLSCRHGVDLLAPRQSLKARESIWVFWTHLLGQKVMAQSSLKFEARGLNVVWLPGMVFPSSLMSCIYIPVLQLGSSS